MNELRWILLIGGALALIAIYLHGRRKRYSSIEQPARRDENLPQLDEPAYLRRRESASPISAHAARVSVDDLPEVHAHDAPVSVPASQHLVTLTPEEAMSTAALDRLTVTQPLHYSDGSKAKVDPIVTTEIAAASTETSASARAPIERVARAPTEGVTRAPTENVEHAPLENSSSSQRSSKIGGALSARKIVALRVPAGLTRFPGARLRELFNDLGLRHGRYGIYHRSDTKGAPIFSVASIVEPGTFDPSNMAQQEYPGVSLFLQLPGPVEGVAAFNAMLECAQTIQREFDAVLQGERGKELTEETVERVREDIANFQHLTRSTASV